MLFGVITCVAVCLSESCINLICICRCFCYPDERFKISSATYSPFYTMIAKPRNKKQQLRNDIISFLSNLELKWHGSEIPSGGEAFMKAMVDTLWQIDGQHDVFKSRNSPIPSCFDSFNGYNQPHLSKHRKCERQNMSSTSLHLSADSLFGCLQGVY